MRSAAAGCTARGAPARSRRHAVAALALLGAILLSQTLLAAHRVAHDNADHVVCALCVAADHQAGPAPHVAAPAEVAQIEAVASTARATPARPFVAVYRSRAPPSPIAA
jgi:hypothetical protein